MRFPLHLKFIVSCLVFGLFSFLGISTLSSYLLTEHIIEKKADAFYQEGLYLSDQYMANYFEHQENLYTRSTIQSYIEALDIYLDADIWLINKDGRIILDSSNTYPLGTETIIPNFNPVLPKGQYYTIGNFFTMFSEETLSVLVPVTHKYHIRGYVAIHTSMQKIVQEKEGYLISFYITLMMLMIFVTLFALSNGLFVYAPLRQLKKASKEYASGNFDYKIKMNREDEMGRIAHTMNFMASALKERDEDQRKLISNISHDFRSPLTSIRGYIEAMLDGTIPIEMQEKYLSIVLLETDRLTKLTSGLLTLNSMNPKQNRLDKTNFDINMVIKNTAASFEGTCTSKRIVIDLLFYDFSCYVYADMGKIQQVLYNLIDNAIKFSHSDSVITIETTMKHEKIFVSVRDTGIGIPKESLKKIWERFYKTDLSRGKDKKGTGLGLSIVKEIIQLHDENINVISTEGVGTEFTFSLSKTKEEEANE